MITYKTTIPRYCPAREQNVQIEICRHDDGSVEEHCLVSSCGRGGCRVCRSQTKSNGSRSDENRHPR